MSHTHFVLCINHIYIIIKSKNNNNIIKNLYITDFRKKYLNVCNQLTHKLEQTCWTKCFVKHHTIFSWNTVINWKFKVLLIIIIIINKIYIICCCSHTHTYTPAYFSHELSFVSLRELWLSNRFDWPKKYRS